MAFQLNNVVPWGRNMEEYKTMFLLNEEDMKKKIAGFGDGPASFNFEAHCLGCDITLVLCQDLVQVKMRFSSS